MTTLGEVIRRYREAKGWSQTDLARTVGVKQPSIQNIEGGRTKEPRKLIQIARALDIPQSELPFNFYESDVRHLVDNPTVNSGSYDFPVYYSAGATSGQHGEVIVSADPVEFVERPTILIKVKNSYGVRVSGTSMEPAYEAGDVVFIHPYLHPSPGCDILFRIDSHGEQRAMIKRLVRETPTHWHLQQWNPGPGEKTEFSVLKSAWPMADRIVGKYNRR